MCVNGVFHGGHLWSLSSNVNCTHMYNTHARNTSKLPETLILRIFSMLYLSVHSWKVLYDHFHDLYFLLL